MINVNPTSGLRQMPADGRGQGEPRIGSCLSLSETVPTAQQTPLIPAEAGIQGPQTVTLGPRNGVPATHSASQTRVNALLLSRGAPRGDERKEIAFADLRRRVHLVAARTARK